MPKRKKQKGKSQPKPPAPQPAGDAWRWVTRQQAAELMQCSVENIDKLTANKKLEKDATGKISIASAIAYTKSLGGDKKRELSTMEAKELKYKTLFRKVKARSASMDLKLKRGEFISRDEVNQNYQLTLTAARNAIMEWVTRLPEKFSGMDVRDIAVTLDGEARKVLQDLSAQLTKARATNGNADASVQAAGGTEAGTGRKPETPVPVLGNGTAAGA